MSAKKPHEETWALGVFSVAVCGPEGRADLDAGRERLARAAPLMAQALRSVLLCQNAGPCSNCDTMIRRALAKAGVLP